MDFGRLLADPIMEDTVVKQLFFSSRRYGRFSLHSVRCDACAIRLNIAFFHVFWFPTDCIPIRQGAFFGRQIGPPKREHSKRFKTCNVTNACRATPSSSPGRLPARPFTARPPARHADLSPAAHPAARYRAFGHRLRLADLITH